MGGFLELSADPSWDLQVADFSLQLGPQGMHDIIAGLHGMIAGQNVKNKSLLNMSCGYEIISCGYGIISCGSGIISCAFRAPCRAPCHAPLELYHASCRAPLELYHALCCRGSPAVFGDRWTSQNLSQVQRRHGKSLSIFMIFKMACWTRVLCFLRKWECKTTRAATIFDEQVLFQDYFLLSFVGTYMFNSNLFLLICTTRLPKLRWQPSQVAVRGKRAMLTSPIWFARRVFLSVAVPKHCTKEDQGKWTVVTTGKRTVVTTSPCMCLFTQRV